MKLIGGVQYKCLIGVITLAFMGINTVSVSANNMTQMEIVQSIVNEQLLHEDGNKPDAQNPVVEEVLRIRGRRTGETIPGYLTMVAKDLMPASFYTQYKDLDIVINKGRLIVRVTEFKGDMFELTDWMDEVASTILNITDPSTVREVSMQVWVSSSDVFTDKYER